MSASSIQFGLLTDLKRLAVQCYCTKFRSLSHVNSSVGRYSSLGATGAVLCWPACWLANIRVPSNTTGERNFFPLGATVMNFLT